MMDGGCASGPGILSVVFLHWAVANELRGGRRRCAQNRFLKLTPSVRPPRSRGPSNSEQKFSARYCAPRYQDTPRVFTTGPPFQLLSQGSSGPNYGIDDALRSPAVARKLPHYSTTAYQHVGPYHRSRTLHGPALAERATAKTRSDRSRCTRLPRVLGRGLVGRCTTLDNSRPSWLHTTSPRPPPWNPISRIPEALSVISFPPKIRLTPPT